VKVCLAEHRPSSATYENVTAGNASLVRVFGHAEGKRKHDASTIGQRVPSMNGVKKCSIARRASRAM
jgi:hypothetical protein